MARSRYTGKYTISKEEAIRAWKRYDQENKEEMEENKRIAEERLAKRQAEKGARKKAPPLLQQQSDEGDDDNAKPAASKMKQNKKTDDGQTSDAKQRSKRTTRSTSDDDDKPTMPTMTMSLRATRASSPQRSSQRGPPRSPQRRSERLHDASKETATKKNARADDSEEEKANLPKEQDASEDMVDASDESTIAADSPRPTATTLTALWLCSPPRPFLPVA